MNKEKAISIIGHYSMAFLEAMSKHPDAVIEVNRMHYNAAEPLKDAGFIESVTLTFLESGFEVIQKGYWRITQAGIDFYNANREGLPTDEYETPLFDVGMLEQNGGAS